MSQIIDVVKEMIMMIINITGILFMFLILLPIIIIILGIMVIYEKMIA